MTHSDSLTQASDDEAIHAFHRRTHAPERHADPRSLTMTNSYDVEHGLSQVHPGANEPLEVAKVPATPAAGGWLPIESAPQPGRTLLLGYWNSLGKWRTVRGQWMSLDYIAENWEEPDDAEEGWFETAVEAEDAPNCWRITPTHWQPLPAAPGVSTVVQWVALTDAARDVLAERQRQISTEGWTPEHDDKNTAEQLALAAVCYALPQGDYIIPEPPEFWPWDVAWWKPGDRRRELIKAGALIQAEIERLDRAAPQGKGGEA